MKSKKEVFTSSQLLSGVLMVTGLAIIGCGWRIIIGSMVVFEALQIGLLDIEQSIIRRVKEELQNSQ